MERGTALITGASSGIGRAFVKQLANEGFNLIIIARRQEKLAVLAKELSAITQNIQIVKADLSQSQDVEKVADIIKGCHDLSLLINNAGFGTRGYFAKNSWDSQLAMLSVHDFASTRLIHAALPGMLKQNKGSIINVASMLGKMPQTNSVTYGASKAFLIALSRALNKELKKTQVFSQTLCPGLTRSEFFKTEVYKGHHGFEQLPSWLWMSPESVAKLSLKALSRQQAVVVPGVFNRVIIVIYELGQWFGHFCFWRKRRDW